MEVGKQNFGESFALSKFCRFSNLCVIFIRVLMSIVHWVLNISEINTQELVLSFMEGELCLVLCYRRFYVRSNTIHTVRHSL